MTTSNTHAQSPGLLTPYRVLDLTDEKGWLCGKLLGDMGADVIKIEPPGGDPGRCLSPFAGDTPNPEKNLSWWAYNTSKRGITLDLHSESGRVDFLGLARSADLVIESFAPSYLDGLGLGFARLKEVNPGLILVSITPYGQEGPYRNYKATDLVAWAMGGYMYPFGDADRSPLRIGYVPQAYLHAAAEGAVGAVTALWHRVATGRGQHVDVSMQEAIARLDMTTKWDMLGVTLKRGEWLTLRNVRGRNIWRCKDGYVIWYYTAGPAAELLTLPFVRWVEDEGMKDTLISRTEWTKLGVTTEEEIAHLEDLSARLEEPTSAFFMARTKDELMAGAIKYNILLYPIAAPADVLKNPHLASRDFWRAIDQPELGRSLTHPGPFFRSTEGTPSPTRRAPRIGEHNREILGMEPPAFSPRITSGASPAAPPRKPLEGIRVADFCWAYVGPLTTKLLADLGAEVVKIEGRTRPDVERAAVPPFKDNIPGFNRDGHFNAVNTSKMSLAINLATPKGRQVARRMAAWADVVVDNFAGGAMQRMGLAYDVLRQINPRLIMLSSAMMGQSGTYLALRGFGQHLTAMTGFNHITGYPDRPPQFLGYYTDFISPHINQLAIIAALDYRRRTGKGMFVDAGQIESCIHFITPVLLDYLVNGHNAAPVENRDRNAAPHGVYRCQGDDRWCAIAVFTDAEWEAFKRAVGNLAWTRETRFATLGARKQNEDALDRLVEAWTLHHSPEHVMQLLQQASVAAGIVQDSRDLYERDPQLKYRGFFKVLDHPEVGKHRVVSPAFRLSDAAYEVTRAPLLGEHNGHVLKNLLHMTDDEVAQLVIEGVLE